MPRIVEPNPIPFVEVLLEQVDREAFGEAALHGNQAVFVGCFPGLTVVRISLVVLSARGVSDHRR